MKRSAILGLCLFMAMVPAAAADIVRDADAEMFPTDVSYDPSIPTPEAFLGRPLGAAPIRHHELVDYITTVANLSDRHELEIAGYTHERRPILFVIATSTANHARLDDIRAEHLRLSEPGSGQEWVSFRRSCLAWAASGESGLQVAR